MSEQLSTNGASMADAPAILAYTADEITKEQLLPWTRQMMLIRRVEELAAKAYTLRKIKGFCHLYIGQEAVCVGATAALRHEDTVVAAYRDHGQIMAKGVSARAVMAELLANGEFR